VSSYSLFTQPVERRSKLQELTQSMGNAVWCGDSVGRRHATGLSTGYAALDAELPDGGWSPFSLTELLWQQQGGGEFRLLAPTLRTVARSGRDIVVLGSPHQLMAPAFAQYGIDVHKLLLVAADKPADRLWATEQVLKSGCTGAVIAWLPNASAEHLRRLQVAASGADTLAFIVRPASVRVQSSPAPLRLACMTAAFGHLSVDVFKRRGPASAAPVLLSPLFLPSMTRALTRAQQAAETRVDTHDVVDRRLPSESAARPRVPSMA
jgi:protein ImuA